MRDDANEHYTTCKTNCDEPRLFNFVTDEDECVYGHWSHACNCDEIAEHRAETAAEAAAEHLAEINSPPAL